MWVYSVEGFVSIVEDQKDSRRVLVRGRSRADITAFAARLGAEVVETPKADYPFRAVATKERVANLLSELVRGIGYPNFKDEVAERQGPKRAGTYHRVWYETRRGMSGADD